MEVFIWFKLKTKQNWQGFSVRRIGSPVCSSDGLQVVVQGRERAQGTARQGSPPSPLCRDATALGSRVPEVARSTRLLGFSFFMGFFENHVLGNLLAFEMCSCDMSEICFQGQKCAEEPVMLPADNVALQSVAVVEHGSEEQRLLMQRDEGDFPVYTWPQTQGCPQCSEVLWLL